MKFLGNLLLILLVAGIAGVVGYYYGRSAGPESQPPAQTEAEKTSVTTSTLPTSPSTATESATEPTEPRVAKPLTISENKSFEEVLADFYGKETFTALFKSEDVARKFVTSVDNALGEVQPSWKISPLNGPESDFVVTKHGKKMFIGAKNFKRYTPYVDLLRKADVDQMMDIYSHFYSSFQSIYDDLGVQKQFNDQVLEVIDNLLDTPDISGPVSVFRASPHGRYIFKNDSLEDLTPAQKILVRMGPENEKAVKEKLRLLQTKLMRFGKKKN